MNKKLRVAVLFGGKSAEHEVSIESAKNVYESLDRDKYDVSLIGIDKKGAWHPLPEKYLLESSIAHKQIAMDSQDMSFAVREEQGKPLVASSSEIMESVDVVFPVLHGPFGEDGSMQGFLKINNLPFVGPGVLGSAVAMDKDVAKRLLRDAGLPIGKFVVLEKAFDKLRQEYIFSERGVSRVEEPTFESIKERLGLPFFIKPANLGSSVGVTKVHDEEEFAKAVDEAFEYDTKIIVEEFIQGREIECSVLGNENPQASIPGEIAASHEFYDYDAKYIDEKGADLKIPAELSDELVKEAQDLAVKTFQALCLEGMARVDLFLTEDNKFYVNEANTIPGFTNISMYPKLWEASGIGHKELVDRLIELAIERYKREQELKSSI